MTPVVPMRFQIGARTILSIPRRLERVGLSLDQALSGLAPVLPALPADADGYLVRSAPAATVDAIEGAGLIRGVRQHYVRRYADLTIGYDAWLSGLSGNARSTLKRKAKKLAQAVDHLEVRRFRAPDELAVFHTLARPLAALTYQEKLLGGALPDGPAFLAEVTRLGTADRARGWLMLADGVPIAYLWCTADGDTLRYDHVGHDPAWSALSPGTVLHVEAFRDLFTDRFRRFDFTEGDGQHKRQFATGGVECADLLLLRPTLANRAALAALGGFDAAVARAKRIADHPRLRPLARRLRRAG